MSAKDSWLQRGAQIRVANGSSISILGVRRKGSCLRQEILPADGTSECWRVSILPAPAVRLRWISLPLRHRKQAVEVLPSMLDVELPFPVEDCVYGIVDWRNPSQGSLEALVYTARKEDVQRRLRAESAEEDSHVLIPETVLWAAATQTFLSVTPKGTVWLLVRWADRLTAVVYEHGVYEFSIAIRLDGGGPKSDHGAVETILRRLRAHKPVPDGVSIRILGSGFSDPAALQHPFQQQGLSVDWTELEEPEVLSSLCLADFLAFPNAWELNVRQGELVHPDCLRYSQRLEKRGFRSVVTASFLTILLCVLGQIAGHQREISLQNTLTSRAQELAPGRRIFAGQEVLLVRRYMEESGSAWADANRALDGTLYRFLQELILSSSKAGVRVSRLWMDPKGVRIEGLAETQDSGDRFRRWLQKHAEDVRWTLRDAEGEGFPFSASFAWEDR